MKSTNNELVHFFSGSFDLSELLKLNGIALSGNVNYWGHFSSQWLRLSWDGKVLTTPDTSAADVDGLLEDCCSGLKPRYENADWQQAI